MIIKSNKKYFFHLLKNYDNAKGFTLVELLVAAAVIIIMSAIVLANYRIGDEQFALLRSAHKLAQDLRLAQELSMSAKHYDCGDFEMKGYGIKAEKDNDFYSLMARCENQDYEVELLEMEKWVKICSVHQSASSASVFFYPPDPTINFIPDVVSIEIKLCLKKEIDRIKTVIINKAGLINVQ